MGSRSIFDAAFLFFFYSSISAVAAAQGGGGRQLWCVAKNNADDAALQSALDWCCGNGGTDCGPIQNGGPCYDASDLQRTASFAFNNYYLRNGPAEESCDFGNTAALTSIDPSFHNCKFPSSVSLVNGNFTGQTMDGSDGPSDLNSRGSRAQNWAWGSLTVPLIFAAASIANVLRY